MGNQPGKLQHHNQSGRPKKNVHWKSAERPSPPGRPILIPLSDQQPDVVNLRWERPKLDGGSPITGYVVEHRRMGSPHWVRATPTPVTQCEVSISGLEPGWRYQFRTIAENVVGRSEPSELSDALTVTLQRNAISVPRFIDELEVEMQAVEDERIEFRVRVLGQPQPEINWFKDGYEIFSSRRTKIVNDNDVSVLIIHQVALTDEGEIKCTATNRAGHVVTKAKLQVQAPPKIRLPRTYEDGLIVEADEVLRLKVGIAGQPPPSVTWLHEGEIVPNEGRFEIVNTERNSLLKIDNVERDDRGEYSIRAFNGLGEDVTSFLVTVTARPNPPGKVRLNMSFGKSATLSWLAPIDDGGCKIGNYIVEYFRIGWNVWLKAATTRSLSTTLNDLIEGSEYKFRVKAENPYGLSDPSEESEVLFIPDPKRGINKPKSASKINEENSKQPVPPRRKTLSPSRPQQDAATETSRVSPLVARKLKPQLLDNDDLHREMSYGTPDQVLKMDVRKSPSMSSADSAAQSTKSKLSLNVEPTTPTSKSPQHSPKIDKNKRPQFLPLTQPLKDKSTSPLLPKTPSPLIQKSPSPLPLPVLKPPLASPERSTTPEITKFFLNNKRSLSPVKTLTEERKPSPLHKSPTPPEHNKISTSALQRSAEPVELDGNQHVRRFSGHALSPAKNAPALAIAIATSSLGVFGNNSGNKNNNGNKNDNGNKNGDGNRNGQSNKSENINKNGNEKANGNPNGNHNGNDKQNAATITNPTIQISAPPLPQPSLSTTTNPKPVPRSAPPMVPRSLAEKHDDVHTSNEFMLVVFDKNSKVKDKDKQDSFELDLEDALQPPPISISAPDLASLEFTNLHTFPLRRSVSSTELLYERAMARFYEAVELEEAEKARKLRISQDKIATPSNVQPSTIRKRLGSMTETERLSFERRSELRRQSTDLTKDLKTPMKWGSSDNLASIKPAVPRSSNMSSWAKRQVSQESQESRDSRESDELSDYPSQSAPHKDESYELGSDYTESTASSDQDSIEKFKMELMARTRSPSPRELETYHPRNMNAGVFTPYRSPTPEQAAVVLNRPMPLPSPDFVPKPILKRSSNESVQQSDSNGTSGNPHSNVVSPGSPVNEKLDIAKGIKSFFKRDKRSTTEKNTEENELLSQPKPNEKTEAIAAEIEVKRRTKEDEDRKRKEAESIMQEEARAAADHYGDLVRQVSITRKYHTPLYLDRDELKKAAERAEREGIPESDVDVSEQMQMQRTHSPDGGSSGLMPPISNKPRLSISERGQIKHVRETASDLALIERDKPKIPDTPSEDNAPQFSIKAEAQPEEPMTTISTVISETVMERPDSRGRTRLVKVKRIIKKRVPSSTRSRDASVASRPPSSLASTQDISDTQYTQASSRRRIPSTARTSKSPGPLSRSPRPLSPIDTEHTVAALSSSNEMLELKSREQLSEEAHEKVRSALSYSTDLVLFVVACYIYLFKDARLVLPILALLIYRQLGEVISAYIPNWMKRKKE